MKSKMLKAFSLTFFIGFLLSTAVLWGCSASTRHIAIRADATLLEVINAIHSEEQTALCGQATCAGSSKVENLPGWTLARSQSFNKKLLPAAEAGRQFNQLLAGWKPGTPVPQAVNDAIMSLGASLGEVVKDFPPGTTKETILSNISYAQSIILTAFNIVLAVKGV